MSKKEILQFLKKTIANSPKVCDNSKCNIEVWLSLVEHHVRDVGVASSNLVTSTKKILPFSAGFFYVKNAPIGFSFRLVHWLFMNLIYDCVNQ